MTKRTYGGPLIDVAGAVDLHSTRTLTCFPGWPTTSTSSGPPATRA